MRLAFRALTQWLITWWTKDRIRVPRGEGKLLRVFAGDRLIIRDTLLTVRDRCESHRSGVTEVTLTLTEFESTGGELWYLNYSKRSGGLRCSLAVAEKLEALRSSDASMPTLERCFIGEKIVLKQGSDSRELLPEDVSILQRR